MLTSTLGIIDPNDWWHTGRPYGLPGTTAIHFDQPGYRNPTLAGADNLGIISNEVQRTLGATPTDEEMSTFLQYMPVQSGWIYAQQGLGDPDTMVPLVGPAGMVLQNQKRQLLLSTINTIALTVLASISIWKLLKE